MECVLYPPIHTNRVLCFIVSRTNFFSWNN